MDNLVDVLSDNREAVVVVTVFAVAALPLIRMRMSDGVGPFHANQFRVYFVVGPEFATAEVAERLAQTFVHAFDQNPVARVEEEYPTDDGVILTFYARDLPARVLEKVSDWERPDRVEFHPPMAGESDFAASTQKLEHAGPFDFHFLAGTRSWRVAIADDCFSFGEPGCGPDSGSVMFLETAALERYSTKVYVWGHWYFRREIKRTWRNYLRDGLSVLAEVEVLTLGPRPEAKLDRGGAKFCGEKWKKARGSQRSDRPAAGYSVWWRAVEVDDVGELRDDGYMHRLLSLHPHLEPELRNLP